MLLREGLPEGQCILVLSPVPVVWKVGDMAAGSSLTCSYFVQSGISRTEDLSHRV